MEEKIQENIFRERERALIFYIEMWMNKIYSLHDTSQTITSSPIDNNAVGNLKEFQITLCAFKTNKDTPKHDYV